MDQKTSRQIAKALIEAADNLEPGAGQPPSDMTISNLKQIVRDAEAIMAILSEDMEIMGWAEDQVSQAKAMVNSVRNYIEGDFGSPTSASTGRECMVVELEPGRWFAFLGDDSASRLESEEDYDRWSSSHDTEWVAVEGPAPSESAAYDMVANRYGNPGGYSALSSTSMSDSERATWLKRAHKIKPGIKLPKPRAPVAPKLSFGPVTRDLREAAGGLARMLTFPEDAVGLTTANGYTYFFIPSQGMLWRYGRGQRGYVNKIKDESAALDLVKQDQKGSIQVPFRAVR